MKAETLIDCKIKEKRGKHLVTVDKITGWELNKAIQYLVTKYCNKNIIGKITSVFKVAGQQLDKNLEKGINAEYRKK